MTQTTSQTNISSPDIVSTIPPLTKEQLAEYHANGFLIVRNVFDSEELKPLQKACEDDPKLWEEETEYVYSNQKPNRVMIYHTLSDSLLGVMPRMARMVDSTESILQRFAGLRGTVAAVSEPVTQMLRIN